MNFAIILKRLGCSVASLSLAAGAGAQTFTVLKTFNPNINATGIEARGTLALAPDGTLYGVAARGGAGAAGVIFRVQTNGTGFTVIKDFPLVDAVAQTNTDGANPMAGLLLSGGTLYGTTQSGGSGGCGTVFSLSTNGTGFTVLKSFSPLSINGTNTDGANPVAALVLAGGTLFGTAQFGGAGTAGTIYRVNTNGTGFTNLFNFSEGPEGGNPMARLLVSGGTLYGTASDGGDADLGTVFSISTNGTGFTRLRSFSGTGTDGSAPTGGLILVGGQLFGTTQTGDGVNGGGIDDGTVFRLDTNGNNFTNLYSFSGSDGLRPSAELLVSGSTLYGTCSGGGSIYGTVFKLNTDGSSFATVHTLTGNDGSGPHGGLVLAGSRLYGTTVFGGILPTVFAFANGVVFSVDVSGGAATDLCIFTEASGASEPATGLTLSSNTLFGTTQFGGTAGNGTLFKLNTNGSGYAEVHSFSTMDSGGANPDGANPRAAVTLSGGTFYGTTRYGGTAGWGTVFKLNADGTGFTNVYSFPSTNAESPIVALVASGGVLFGTGGGGSFGTVFRINTNGNGLTNIYSFNGTDGNLSTAGLILSGSTLYGTTQIGGTGSGNIFQVNTDGTHYTNIYNFGGGADGANPGTVLVLSNNVLYGTAYHGGSNNQGTIFKINTDRTGFTVIHTFGGTNSNGAGAGDLLLSGSTIYGETANGGAADKGTIFKLDTAGNNFTVLKNFNGTTDGANPATTMVLAGNTLYGTTQLGGTSGHGTVFSLALSSSSVVPIPLSIRSISNAVVLSWTDPASAFSLQAAPLVTGNYTNVPNATSPYTNGISGTSTFFRLQAN